MADYYCDNIFALSFYFRSIPLQKNMRLKLKTLHSRMLGLLRALPYGDHIVWVNNLMVSFNFAAQSLN